MGWFLGKCPDLVESFVVTATFPQCQETNFTVPRAFGERFSPIVNVSRGIWSVSYFRTVIAWDGTPTTHPIKEQGFTCGLDAGPEDANAFQFKFYLGSMVSWPCNTPSNSFFTEPPSLFRQGFEASPGNGDPCASTFLFEEGCPNCQSLIPIRLCVLAAVTAPEVNFKSFSVRATGTRIG